jgi:hypothetical protein
MVATGQVLWYYYSRHSPLVHPKLDMLQGVLYTNRAEPRFCVGCCWCAIANANGWCEKNLEQESVSGVLWPALLAVQPQAEHAAAGALHKRCQIVFVSIVLHQQALLAFAAPSV